jgi:hypothetical protein
MIILLQVDCRCKRGRLKGQKNIGGSCVTNTSKVYMKRNLGPTRSRDLDCICGSPWRLLDLDVRGNTCIQLLAVTREVECACKDSLENSIAREG